MNRGDLDKIKREGITAIINTVAIVYVVTFGILLGVVIYGALA